MIEPTTKSHFPLLVCRQAGISPRLCIAATAEQGRETFCKLLIYRLSRFYRFCVIIPAVILSTGISYGQKFLTDTLYVEFKGDSLHDASQVCVKAIYDNRDEDPDFVMYQTKKKFLLFPVDQEIHLTKPLSEAIYESMKHENDCPVSYTLNINKFGIEKRKGRFSSSTHLVADIPVFENKNDSQFYYGTLYYDHLFKPQNKKESFTGAVENILCDWHRTFKTDMTILNTTDLRTIPEPTLNLLTDPDVRPLYMNIQTGIFAGLNWYGLQGEIYFTRPETQTKNKIVSGIVRYQNNPDYESLAIGSNSEHFTFRHDKKLVFDLDLNILLGFLRWNDVETNKPTIYQIINAEISSVQSIVFNRQNKKGFTARMGAIETLVYIYDMKLRFQAGALLGFGYKF